MGRGSPNFDIFTENLKSEQRISGINELSETRKYMDNSLYAQSLVSVLTSSAHQQQCLSTGKNPSYDQSFVPVLTHSLYNQHFISTGTNYASSQQFVSIYKKTKIILLGYYSLSY